MHLPDPPKLYVIDTSPSRTCAVVLLHEYGLDGRMWADVANHLSPEARIIIPDLRGHGSSPSQDGEWSLRDITYDIANTLFSLGVRDAVIVGLGVGGMIAQALAAEVPNLVRAMVLIGTGAKLETEQRWMDRGQLLADLPDDLRAARLLENATYSQPSTMLQQIATSTPAQSIQKICEAVAHTDLRRSTDALRLPTLGLVGRNDHITPPDLMREMIDGIPGASFELIPRCGHLTPYDAPDATAQWINRFLEQTGHLLPDPNF